jgi:3-oxoacyl-[acyl-carrier protein] reductase
MSLEGKTAVITGASRGLGRAIALQLAGQGARVVINYARDSEGAQATLADVLAAGGAGCVHQADVSETKAAEGMIKAALESYGSVDVLVNNAGTTRDTLIMMMPESDWDIVIQTNLKSAFNCSKAAVKQMMRKRAGRIINITSVSGIAGNAGQTNYSASKAGLIGFTRALAREVATRNITVNAVAPGFVPTALTGNLPDELKEASLKSIPLGRWGTPEDVAHAVAFLASDEAGYITGQVLCVDGGMVMA